MNKAAYFIKALNSTACLKKEWANSVFSVVIDSPDTQPFDYQLKTNEDGSVYFIDPSSPQGGLTAIETPPIKDSPLFEFRESITIKEGDIVNYKGPPIQTTYGRLYVNQLSLVLPFGDLFPFNNGLFNLKEIELEIGNRLIDDLDEGEVPPLGKIQVKDYLVFCDNIITIATYNHLCVSSTSKRSLLSHPDARKVRADLVNKNKDNLTDPVVISKIGDELEKLDREWLKGDPTAPYYQVKDKKLYGAVRKKMYYHFGGESPFQDGTHVEYIEKSLEEGIDIDHMPAMVNSLRYGSYNRGKQTQLGGESTKTIYRMLGTLRIAVDDCGTTLGLPMKITPINKKQFIGVGIIENGQTKILTNETINNYIGTTPIVRGPLTCKAEGRNVCGICIGQQFAEQPEGLAAAAAGLGGRFLSLFLSAFHAKGLTTVKWKLENTFS